MSVISVLLFSCVAATAYICMAVAYRQSGAPSLELSYLIKILVNPFFFGGLLLSLSTTFIRLAMFRSLGITATVIASELSVAMMIVLSWLVLGDVPSRFQLIGAAFVMTGVLLVVWNGGK